MRQNTKTLIEWFLQYDPALARRLHRIKNEDHQERTAIGILRHLRALKRLEIDIESRTLCEYLADGATGETNKQGLFHWEANELERGTYAEVATQNYAQSYHRHEEADTDARRGFFNQINK